MEKIITIIVWLIILVVVIVSFCVMIYFSSRYFNKRQIIMIFDDNKTKIKKVKFVKIGNKVDVNSIYNINNFKDYRLISINSLSNIEGDLNSFIMPNEDVNLIFVKNYVKKIPLDNPLDKYVLQTSKSIDDILNTLVFNPVNLNSEEIIDFINSTNLDVKSFPILNNLTVDENKSFIILKIGDLIYGILYYKENVFKFYLRLSLYYVNQYLSNKDFTYHFDDIYSILIDSSFKDKKEALKILIESYHFTLDKYYEKKVNNYILKNDVEKDNSHILSIDYNLAKVFDPSFDKAVLDSKLYLINQNKLHNLLKQLDKTIPSYKEQLFSDLNNIEDNLENFDTYNNNKMDVSKLFLVSYDKEGIKREFDDLDVINPSKLLIENILDYVSSKKDMFLLNVTKNKNSNIVFYYLKEPFLMISKNLDRNFYRFSIRLDSNFKNKLLIKHPNIFKIKSIVYSDYYMMYLDTSFISYEEIYDIILNSYNYVKSSHLESENENE